MAQFKPKFEIGDRVIVVKKNNDNFGCIGTIHQRETVEWLEKRKSKMRYTVSFEENGVVMHYADFYAEDLKFVDLHSFAQHCEKELNEFKPVPGAPLKVCKYCYEPFNNDDELFRESEEEPGACEYCVKIKKKYPKVHNRKSIAVDLKDFSIYGHDDDWLEVTEWTNGEGIDIDIHYDSDHEEDIRNFKLSYDELGIIMNIINKFGKLPIIYTKTEN